jgi:hypothetical protein
VRLALLLVLPFSCVATRADERPYVRITLSPDRVSVDAHAPLPSILAEIGRLSGVPIRLDATVVAEPTSVRLEAPTLEEGLRRLLWNRDFLLVYSDEGLAEVRVLGGERGLPRDLEVEAATLGRLRVEALHHPDPAVRVSALDRLAVNGEQALVLKTALEVLEREPDEEVLKSALDHLLAHESVPVEPVLNLVAGDRDPALRAEALDLLGEHGRGDQRVSDTLRVLVRTEQDAGLRETARTLLNEWEGE